MYRQPSRPAAGAVVTFAIATVALAVVAVDAQSRRSSTAPQKVDEAYGAKIKEYTQDPRVITELVDHVPASDTVPSPLKFFGRIPGTPDELTYSKDIYRYFDALDQASPRVKVFRIGQTEEGRDMITVVDRRRGDDCRARQAQERHRQADRPARHRRRRRTGAHRHRQANLLRHRLDPFAGNRQPRNADGARLPLAVGESPFIQQIRNSIIFAFTPIVEVDGRDKQVDTWYFRKRTGQVLPLMYWGKYVAHDNNRDGMGQSLKLTQNLMRAFLEWHPTVFHDLHESVPYLYTSTGTGPYNESLDPVVVDEWWMLAKYEVAEMTKRGVPGIWTWGFYDGWVPNYLFFIANSHNSIGRFYETQSYGPMNQEVTLGPTQTSREWFRANPPRREDQVGPAQQRQHAAVGAPLRVELRREEQGDVPRELLAEEQAERRAWQEPGALRLDCSGRAAPPCRGRGAGQPVQASGRGGAHGRTPTSRAGGVARPEGRLRLPDGSALSHPHRHADGRAVLRPGESAAV